MAGFSASVEKSWYKPRGWTIALAPLAWLFRQVVEGRRRKKKTTAEANFPIPIVVAGNISVGGTGKTPLIIALVKALQGQGYSPGVVSRGHGGKAASEPLWVNRGSTADEVGDEPMLIAGHCPVVVCRDRLKAARHLEAQTDCDVILSDDGLQHYALPRDFEIAVVDGQRGFGNGLCLPAGPLREPVKRLASVDAVLVNGGELPLDWLATPVFHAKLEPVCFRRLKDNQIASISGQPWQAVHAVAGIGNPRRFADTLGALGFQVDLQAYPDHHAYTGRELIFDDALPVIITAKDAVKFQANRQALLENIWVLDVEMVLQAGFVALVCDTIARLKTTRY